MTEPSPKRTLLTCALPYANGDIHLGHMVEHVLADIHVRFLRMTGAEVVFLCASDAHGSPIELKARELGQDPADMVARYNRAHHADLERFGVHYDEFYTTHSEETRKHSYAIFEGARAGGLIYTQDVEGFFSEVDQRFLPDRWIRGTCPRCGALDQYGDSCEVCGSTYRPTDLLDPRSAISGDEPVLRTSKHYFLRISDRQEFLRGWVNTPEHMPAATRGFVNEWLEAGLRDWDISRDAPYFGFLIPGETDKYFYVWLDAPVGYIGTTEKWCNDHGRRVEDYWRSADTRIVHVIGKDIVPFHTLFWPAMLDAAGYNLPSRVQVHGFLTVNGEKMSKSRGTFINARVFAEHVDPQYLRFYFASKLRSEPDDLDMHLGTWGDPDDPASLDASKSELVERVNAELVNKIANLASRVIKFVREKLDGRVGALPPESAEVARRFESSTKPAIAAAYASFDLATALRGVVEVSEAGNAYLQGAAPWKLAATEPERARSIAALGASYVAVIAGLVKPVVPEWAARVERALGVEPLAWDAIGFHFENRPLGDPAADIRIDRMDPEKVKSVVLASRAGLERKGAPTSTAKAAATPSPKTKERAMETEKSTEAAGGEAARVAPLVDAEITIDEFSKVDLRVGLVKNASLVEGADKLLRLEIDLGEGRLRNIFAGIRKHYAPETLVGRRVVVVANLAPRKMKWGVSEGMVLAATDLASPKGAERVLVLEVDGEPATGSTIK
ncbi:MAG: methionine--tRNA ligase [Deltaproteobacteria bacterium]|nr:methionine--tRNA ligase [Deltaproteobacteria bacterium]